MEIGLRIKEVREQLRANGKKVSQVAFGESIGVSRDVVANIETGRVAPDQRTVMLICREFNVNENWLRTGEGEMFNSLEREKEIALFFRKISKHPDSELDQFRQNLIISLAKLDETEWESILQIIKKLTEKKTD